jgi:ATP-binding cassette subfamily F protein uup
LPGEIERIGVEIASAEEALHDPDLFARDPSQFAELTRLLDQLRAAKDAAEHRWLEVAEMAEALAR